MTGSTERPAAAFVVGEGPLRLGALDAALGRTLRVQISATALDRVRAGRAAIERILQRGDVVYGVNTGFGILKNQRIDPLQLEQLQERLLISHACGVGPAVPDELVRWMLLFKVNMLAIGHSGVRPEIVERLAQWLEHDLLPVVPARGSLGASGDLAPLAHLSLPLIGRGEMRCNGRTLPAAQGLAEHGLSPLRLAAKEALALINGTQLMSAYGAHAAVRSRRLLDLADLICCMSLEALRGTTRHADPRLHQLRPHPGAQRSAANIRRHMQGSEVLASHAGCDRVQDPYSLRCAPQVHGAARDTVEYAAAVLEREINSVTDNPLVFENEVVSGGNFHGAPLAGTLDFLAIALTDLASMAERRTYLLLHGDDPVPKLLMRDTGINSGFMIPQYTAAALVNECKVLATPASIDTIPTSLGQEDHVSMGATSAVKAWEVLDRAEHVLAIEMLCASQALDFLAPLTPGPGPAAAHAIVRRHIPHAEEDREFHADIREALRLVRENEDLRREAT